VNWLSSLTSSLTVAIPVVMGLFACAASLYVFRVRTLERIAKEEQAWIAKKELERIAKKSWKKTRSKTVMDESRAQAEAITSAQNLRKRFKGVEFRVGNIDDLRSHPSARAVKASLAEAKKRIEDMEKAIAEIEAHPSAPAQVPPERPRPRKQPARRSKQNRSLQ
jgi:hypothetical protein